ncbi:hypothetical protein C8R45DRAFT_832563 [Mycena sanguinolenta]|nr:hypothetical protein C8R45DRAFT_832563 [Mycena sanguinolenta]
MVFSQLPYTPTPAWDDTLLCLVNTRRKYIENVMTWIRTGDKHGADQIFLVADVVGSGKTALAHTIAKECFDAGVLASSFFFDQKADRIRPRDFVFKLARDIGFKFPEVAQHISAALQADPNSIHFLPTLLLFKRLVSEPLIRSNICGPIVIVIDALNEAETSEMHGILGTQITTLPGILRVFVTSRPDHGILHDLGRIITAHGLEIHDSDNHTDMALFVDSEFKKIARNRDLDEWPDAHTTKSLLE